MLNSRRPAALVLGSMLTFVSACALAASSRYPEFGEPRLVQGRTVWLGTCQDCHGNPLADAEGNVFEAPVDQNAEMVEMLESSRQYQNMVEALQTAKQLMLETMRIK